MNKYLIITHFLVVSLNGMDCNNRLTLFGYSVKKPSVNEVVVDLKSDPGTLRKLNQREMEIFGMTSANFLYHSFQKKPSNSIAQEQLLGYCTLLTKRFTFENAYTVISHINKIGDKTGCQTEEIVHFLKNYFQKNSILPNDITFFEHMRAFKKMYTCFSLCKQIKGEKILSNKDIAGLKILFNDPACSDLLQGIDGDKKIKIQPCWQYALQEVEWKKIFRISTVTAGLVIGWQERHLTTVPQAFVSFSFFYSMAVWSLGCCEAFANLKFGERIGYVESTVKELGRFW